MDDSVYLNMNYGVLCCNNTVAEDILSSILLTLQFTYNVIVNFTYWKNINYFPIRGRAPYLALFHSCAYNFTICFPFIIGYCFYMKIFIADNYKEVPRQQEVFKALWFTFRQTLFPLFFIRTCFICKIWKSKQHTCQKKKSQRVKF